MDNYQIQLLVNALNGITGAIDNLTASLEQGRIETTTADFTKFGLNLVDHDELDRLRQAAVDAALGNGK